MYFVHFVRSVYYSDTLELIKYYLAIKVSSASGNISNFGAIISIVISHLEMRACDWSKSRHVAVNKSH